VSNCCFLPNHRHSGTNPEPPVSSASGNFAVRLSLSRCSYLKRRCQGSSTSRLSECIFSSGSPWLDNSTVTRLRDEGETEDDTLTKTKLVTYFHEYTPPFDVRPLMSRMLRSVPSEYLVGLDSIVLTSTDTFSRKRRRSKTRSRRRTVRIVKTRGLYHRAQGGETAWIEIFVDRIIEGWELGLWLKLPLLRDFLLAPVLFHEIGHHIHTTIRPEFREREDVADRWQVKLETIYPRKERPSIRVLSLLAKPFRGVMKRL
jgi:hypothetical protein